MMTGLRRWLRYRYRLWQRYWRPHKGGAWQPRCKKCNIHIHYCYCASCYCYPIEGAGDCKVCERERIDIILKRGPYKEVVPIKHVVSSLFHGGEYALCGAKITGYAHTVDLSEYDMFGEFPDGCDTCDRQAQLSELTGVILTPPTDGRPFFYFGSGREGDEIVERRVGARRGRGRR